MFKIFWFNAKLWGYKAFHKCCKIIILVLNDASGFDGTERLGKKKTEMLLFIWNNYLAVVGCLTKVLNESLSLPQQFNSL